MEQNKFQTLDALINTLILEVRCGHIDIEHTNTSTYQNSNYTGKIIYTFKSCVGKQYKKLVEFCDENNIKYNLIKLPKTGTYEIRTLDYSMDEYRVQNKTYYQMNGKGSVKYVFELNFNDLYRN